LGVRDHLSNRPVRRRVSRAHRGLLGGAAVQRPEAFATDGRSRSFGERAFGELASPESGRTLLHHVALPRVIEKNCFTRIGIRALYRR